MKSSSKKAPQRVPHELSMTAAVAPRLGVTQELVDTELDTELGVV